MKKFSLKKTISNVTAIAIAAVCTLSTVQMAQAANTDSTIWNFVASTGQSKSTAARPKTDNSPSYIYYDEGALNKSIGVFVYGSATVSGTYTDETYCTNGDLWYTVRYKTSRNMYSTIYRIYGSKGYVKLDITVPQSATYSGKWKPDTVQ